MLLANWYIEHSYKKVSTLGSLKTVVELNGAGQIVRSTGPMSEAEADEFIELERTSRAHRFGAIVERF